MKTPPLFPLLLKIRAFPAFVGVVAICYLPSAALAQNLLQDPGLEASTGGSQTNPFWTLTVNNSSAQYQVAPWASNPGGTPGIGVWLKAFSGSVGSEANAALTQSVAGEEDFTYVASVWHKVETNYTSEQTVLGIDFLQGGTLLASVETDLNSLSPNDGSWQEYTVSGNSPPGTDSVRVRAEMVGGIDGGANPQSAMFDDLSLTGAPKVTVPVDALVGFYSFDDPADPFKDDSGNTNDLTSAGVDPTYQASGGFRGGTYDFNGQQRLISPIDINPGTLPNMTMGGWLRTNTLTEGLYKAMGSDDGGWDRTIGLDNREVADPFRYTSFIGNGPPIVGTPGPANTQDWTFMAAVYTTMEGGAGEGTVTVYVDLNANTTSDPLVEASGPTLFGPGHITTSIGSLRPDDVNEGWVGSLDNMFIYDVALTAEELTLVRNSGTPAPSEGDDPDLIVTSEPLLSDLPRDPAVREIVYGIRNGGQNENLNISAINLTGPDVATAHYSVTSFSQSLGPGESGQVVLSFDNGGQVGAFSGLMEIVSDDESDPNLLRDASLTVASTGAADPLLTVVTDPAFGELLPGAGVTTRMIEIQNTGAAESLSVASLLLTGTDAAKYTVDSFPSTLAPGAVGTIQITLDPGGAVGSFSAELEIVSTDATNRFSVIDLAARIPPENIEEALLGFYPFDTGNPRADLSGNGNDLVDGISAEPNYEPKGGIEGGAYTYDGSSHIVAPIDINPSTRPELTMGAFVKASVDVVGAPGLYKILGSDNGGWDRTIGLDNRDADSGFRYTSFVGFGPPLLGTPEVASEEDWTFVAATYNEVAGEVTVYVDLDVSTTNDPLVAVTGPTTFNPGFDSVAIGSLRRDTTQEAWNGVIDNVFFYELVLTAGELTGIRDAGRDAILGAPRLWFTSITVSPLGSVLLEWTDERAPAPYIVEFSDTLGSWIEIEDGHTEQTITVDAAPGFAARYYRVRQAN